MPHHEKLNKVVSSFCFVFRKCACQSLAYEYFPCAHIFIFCQVERAVQACHLWHATCNFRITIKKYEQLAAVKSIPSYRFATLKYLVTCHTCNHCLAICLCKFNATRTYGKCAQQKTSILCGIKSRAGKAFADTYKYFIRYGLHTPSNHHTPAVSQVKAYNFWSKLLLAAVISITKLLVQGCQKQQQQSLHLVSRHFCSGVVKTLDLVALQAFIQLVCNQRRIHK